MVCSCSPTINSLYCHFFFIWSRVLSFEYWTKVTKLAMLPTLISLNWAHYAFVGVNVDELFVRKQALLPSPPPPCQFSCSFHFFPPMVFANEFLRIDGIPFVFLPKMETFWREKACSVEERIYLSFFYSLPFPSPCTFHYLSCPL